MRVAGRRIGRLIAVAMFSTAAVAPALGEPPGPPPAASRTPRQQEADCWYQFMQATGPRIACLFPANLEDADRVQIRRLTRAVLQDAKCDVAIDIERALVDAAVKSGDTVFVVPPQPVTCQIVTSRGTLPVGFTFAPRIEIKGGVAVKAMPGMDHVTGVNTWLAWPVVAYINASGSVEDVMLRVINAYLKRRRNESQ